MTRITIKGHPFEVIPHDGCIVQEGRWTHIISNESDRMPGDGSGVRRVRLDGWPETYEPNVWHDLEVTIKLSENCKRASWINLIEFHDKANTKVAGPFKAVMERWSNGSYMIAVYYLGKFLNAVPFVPYREYHFILRFKVGERMFVALNGASFATILKDFAKGCALYPQFGLYSNEFGKGRMDGRFDIESV